MLVGAAGCTAASDTYGPNARSDAQPPPSEPPPGAPPPPSPPSPPSPPGMPPRPDASIEPAHDSGSPPVPMTMQDGSSGPGLASDANPGLPPEPPSGPSDPSFQTVTPSATTLGIFDTLTVTFVSSTPFV